VTADDKVPAASKEKLEQHTIDFEKLDASGLNAKPWDVVFITCVLYSCFVGIDADSQFPS
jgi:hypothetical protein